MPAILHNTRNKSNGFNRLGSIAGRLRTYWSLIKSYQTILLLVTGVAGYLSVQGKIVDPLALVTLCGSLFLSISGSTVLNMWYDRDIDSKMKRTCWRPLPAGKISPNEALGLGITLSVLGVAWAGMFDLLYGVIVLAGLIFDVAVYTIWLKRRSAWAIIWGGISGGMPVLAGRALAEGRIEWIGILLSLAVLFWIPTHIMTFSIRYFEDYRSAGIPTFPARYGVELTRRVIAVSSLFAISAIVSAALIVGLSIGFMRLIYILSFMLVVFSVTVLVKPSDRANFSLFKYASLYMLLTMIIFTLHVN